LNCRPGCLRTWHDGVLRHGPAAGPAAARARSSAVWVACRRRMGFSLDEIAELLRLEDGTHCEEASGLAEHKLKDVREKMADLARMEAVLSELVCACHARKGNVSCPLIASLQDGTKLAASARGSHGVTTP
ncbi:MerR family DNA-binding protein, partial [Citrobacter portucalensis]|uniref:MerR family DNA-binding protein n=1 Tax=Citrobacter portucalensis TaxID=1639133 RepID=UPI003B432BD1